MEEPIYGYPNYTIDTNGIVRRNGKEVKSYDNNRGYLKVFLFDREGKRKSVRVHRLVAETFLENPFDLPVVNHIDGNKYNNSVDNLEWVSYCENTRQSRQVHIPEIRPIAQISAKNGAIRGVFPSIRCCSNSLGLDYRGLFSAVKSGNIYKDCYWKHCSVLLDFDDSTPPSKFKGGFVYE